MVGEYERAFFGDQLGALLPMLMVDAESKMVLHYRLWPRALLTPFTDDVNLTEADRRVYTMYARSKRFKGFATIRVDFERDPDPHGD